jgi:hypothetical protein
LHRGQLKNGLHYLILPNKVPPTRWVQYMMIGCDRNMDQTVGFDSELNPKVWRVYKRKKGKDYQSPMSDPCFYQVDNLTLNNSISTMRWNGMLSDVIRKEMHDISINFWNCIQK